MRVTLARCVCALVQGLCQTQTVIMLYGASDQIYTDAVETRLKDSLGEIQGCSLCSEDADTEANDVDGRSEELSSIVVGYVWVARITAFSVEFAVLVWFGWFLDKTYSWSPWGILVGALIGTLAFIGGLFATIKRLEDEEVRERLRQFKMKK